MLAGAFSILAAALATAPLAAREPVGNLGNSPAPTAPRAPEPLGFELEFKLDSKLDFNRDVRPILSDRCFGCHGPDAGKGRKAGLRLDTAEGAYAALASGHRAIVPGDLSASEAVRRIHSSDPDEVMPPPELKRPLTDAERGILLRWIAEGAEYRPHWAFVAPRAVGAAADPRRSEHAGWIRDSVVDRLVLARLEAEDLAPEPEASREVLLRRASLALTGLPPTPEEVDAFVADAAPDAYERRVDAMLASPRAAEHMATAWLDLARFADTFGYQSDAECFTWPWRDWLLRALRDNMPYDRFATALVAGDLLTDAASHDERLANTVASAFNRLHRVTEEGGSIAEEFRQEGIADRVSTFGTAFLGLTLECARCHDHKYDPVPTREFYGLAAMFGRIDENGLKSFAHHSSAPPPFVRLASEEQERRTTELRMEALGAQRARIMAMQAVRTATDEDAQAAEHAGETATIALPAPAARYAFDELAEGRTPNAVDAAQPATTDRARPEQLGAIALCDGKSGRAVAFDGDGGLGLAGLSGFTRHDPVSFAFWIRPGERNARAAILHSSGFYTNDADGSGLELLVADGRLRWSVIHLWPGSAASVEMREPLAVGEWTHIVATYDGLSSAAGLRLYANGRAVDAIELRDELDGDIAGATLELGSRSRDAGFRGGAIDELSAWRAELTPAEAALAAAAEPSRDALREHRALVAARAETERLRAANRALAAHLGAIPAFMAMRDSPRAAPTFVLSRGAYDQPDRAQPVTGGAVQAVLAREFAQDANRLDLARWLVDPANPLVARVEVNRLWTQVFGRGLVETSENFGVNGAWPTHPELLDALAHDFARGANAWDRRAMLRRLATSAAFRQSSATSDAKRARDPRNELLSRGASVRLSAEMLRDSALLASGLLVERFGGPSARPWQQPDLVAQSGASGGYSAGSGDELHRRSLYTYRKRTVPPPTMSVFDGGSREACQPRRSATNTPLQFLAILNDPVFTECARALAERAMREAGDAGGTDDIDARRDARIARAFRLACSRAPRAAELDALRELVATRVASGESDELAALTLACGTILASDAAIMSR